MDISALFGMFVIGLLNGFVYAMLLLLLSLGLTVVFGMLRILNIAHTSFYMLGAYLSYSVLQVTGSLLLTVLVTPLGVAVLGMLTERFLLRGAHRLGHSHELLLTLGLMYVVVELVKWIWGSGYYPVAPPAALDVSLPILGSLYPTYRLFVSAVGLSLLGTLALLFFKTRLGMIIRAAVSDLEMVSALGFNVRWLFVWVFGVGTGLAGIAGVIAAPLFTVYPGMAADMLVETFIVVVVGGLGSLKGALIASLLVGELQSLGVLVAPRFAMIFSFLLMTVILIWKPVGLFGDRP